VTNKKLQKTGTNFELVTYSYTGCFKNVCEIYLINFKSQVKILNKNAYVHECYLRKESDHVFAQVHTFIKYA